MLKRVYASAQTDNSTLIAVKRAASLSLSKSVSEKYSSQIAEVQSMRDPLDVSSVRRLFLSNKAAFVDFKFPPSSASIGVPDTQLTWRRVTDILHGNIQVFHGAIEPNGLYLFRNNYVNE